MSAMVALLHADVLIDNGKRGVRIEFQRRVFQFPAEALTIDRLKQTRPERAMQLDRQSYDAIGEGIGGRVWGGLDS